MSFSPRCGPAKPTLSAAALTETCSLQQRMLGAVLWLMERGSVVPQVCWCRFRTSVPVTWQTRLHGPLTCPAWLHCLPPIPCAESSTSTFTGGNSISLKKIVDMFYDKVLADAELAPFFEKINMQKLKMHQVRRQAGLAGTAA